MAATAQRSRSKGGSHGFVLRVVLAIAILVPVGALSVMQWQSTSDSASVKQQERRGIEYLRAMGPLTAALTQAQSTVVAGGSVDGNAVNAAVAGMAEVDSRLGDTLGTRERWTDLRGKLEALLKSEPAAGQAGFDAYSEVTDLLLALYGRVRENSNLIRDPASDAYNLQDGVAEELPEFLVATGRFTDLGLILSGTPARPSSGANGASAGPVDERAIALGRLLAAQAAVKSPAEDLTSDLQAAVAVSESPTLGTSLFGLLDRLRLNIDALSASSVLADGQLTPADASSLAALRDTAVEVVGPLYGSVLDEIDKLIVARLDQDNRDRDITIIALAVGIVVAFGPTLWLAMVAARSRRSQQQAPPGRHGRPDSLDGDDTAGLPYLAWSASSPDAVNGRQERERSGASR